MTYTLVRRRTLSTAWDQLTTSPMSTVRIIYKLSYLSEEIIIIISIACRLGKNKLFQQLYSIYTVGRKLGCTMVWDFHESFKLGTKNSLGHANCLATFVCLSCCIMEYVKTYPAQIQIPQQFPTDYFGNFILRIFFPRIDQGHLHRGHRRHLPWLWVL